ncbi:MAG: ABC transporter ATP-binding protein [Kiritimatiellae bacterium]|nr:ABC transporter ATP-binding protein [Kiritimatiellia bacterium]
MLELRDVSKTYCGRKKEVAALRKVSLRLESGMLAALQGPSGCGKTTLLLVAGGLLAPDSGEVLLDGVDLYSLSAECRGRRRATNIGFVFQQFHLIPYLTAVENVQAPLLASDGTADHKYAEDLLERFGLSARRDHLPGELSTGEKQRTALARAMMNRPGLILADEPTGNLDAANAAIVLDALEQFAEEGGAVLMASHDERAAARGQQLWQMKDGCLNFLFFPTGVDKMPNGNSPSVNIFQGATRPFCKQPKE